MLRPCDRRPWRAWHRRGMMVRAVSLLALLAALAVPPAAASAAPGPSPEPADARPPHATDALRPDRPSWTGRPEAARRRAVLLALLAAERRLDPAGEDVAALSALVVGPGAIEQERAERKLDDAALAWLRRRNGGEPVDPATASRALRHLDRPEPRRPLALVLAELEVVAALGGWRRVATTPGPNPTAEPLALVSPELDVAPSFPRRKRLPEIRSLRQRLVQSADLSATYLSGESMDAHLAEAVRRFQRRHGLAADGVVGPRTLAALNAPVAGHLAQLRVNLARPEDDRRALPRYVEVNVPGFELRLVERGVVTLRSRVIVGDKENPTPIFDDRIRFLELNPFWYVPASIALELLAKEAERPGYLARNGFTWRTPELLVQRPGPENALGRVKFLFPNRHAVYLHDTPLRGLFGRSQRSLSHGCVRVEKSRELALALLAPEGWTEARLDAAFASGRTRRIELKQPVPIFLDYRTAFVDEEGRLHLRPDLYGHDREGVIRFKDKGLPPDATAPPPATAQAIPRPRPPEPATDAVPAAFLETTPRAAPL